MGEKEESIGIVSRDIVGVGPQQKESARCKIGEAVRNLIGYI